MNLNAFSFCVSKLCLCFRLRDENDAAIVFRLFETDSTSYAGNNVYMGKDHTLHAAVAGTVGFKKTKDDRRIVFITQTEAKA